MNKWKIPAGLEQEILKRDKKCIYCGIEFVSGTGGRGAKASWEHIVNDERIVTEQNIARCCISCNASKGAKELTEWLKSAYCKKRGITESTIADVARFALVCPPSLFLPSE